MIDPKTEPRIPLGLATALPPRNRGRRISAESLWRWAVFGCSGIRLEAVKTDQGWRTSRAALERFVAARSRAERELRRPWLLTAWKARGAA